MALLLVAMAASASDVLVPSSAEMLSRIDTEGGAHVLRDLREHETQLDVVLSGIESAAPDWLRVAEKLKPFSDAAASLSLDYAVARALPKAPDRVLALAGHGFDLERICTTPFIEPEPGVAENYEHEALAALATVRTPSLKPLAARCAKGIRLAERMPASGGR